jgi:hypothetical protein
MAHHQLKQEEPARLALDAAERLMESDFRQLQQGIISDDWHDVMITRIIYREALALIRPGQVSSRVAP